jgi:hypothetical protein
MERPHKYKNMNCDVPLPELSRINHDIHLVGMCPILFTEIMELALNMVFCLGNFP